MIFIEILFYFYFSNISGILNYYSIHSIIYLFIYLFIILILINLFIIIFIFYLFTI